MSILKKILLACLLLVTAFMAMIVVWAMSLGYFPGAGKVLGLGGAKDLEVEYTDADYTAARSKIETAIETQTVATTFSDSELTALLNGCTTSICVFDDLQMKTTADGLVEIAGVIEKDRLVKLLADEGLLEGDIADITAFTKYLPAKPAFYIKTALDGTDDTMTLLVSEASVAGISVPDENLIDLGSKLSQAWTDQLVSIEGVQISLLRVSAEGVYIQADLNELDEESLGL